MRPDAFAEPPRPREAVVVLLVRLLFLIDMRALPALPVRLRAPDAVLLVIRVVLRAFAALPRAVVFGLATARRVPVALPVIPRFGAAAVARVRVLVARFVPVARFAVVVARLTGVRAVFVRDVFVVARVPDDFVFVVLARCVARRVRGMSFPPTLGGVRIRSPSESSSSLRLYRSMVAPISN